jgi:hypothetical protein
VAAAGLPPATLLADRSCFSWCFWRIRCWFEVPGLIGTWMASSGRGGRCDDDGEIDGRRRHSQ